MRLRFTRVHVVHGPRCHEAFIILDIYEAGKHTDRLPSKLEHRDVALGGLWPVHQSDLVSKFLFLLTYLLT